MAKGPLLEFLICLGRYILYHLKHSGFYRPREPDNKARKKVELVKSLWIGSGCLMLIIQATPIIVFLAVITTFTSFIILDETP